MNPRAWRARNHDLQVTQKIRNNVYRVNGHRGIDYITNLAESQCSCPDWQKNRPRKGCKHILYVRLKIAEGEVDPPNREKASSGFKRSPEYPDDWNVRRQRVLNRDGRTCQQCGDTGSPLHVHHVVPIGKGGGNDLENLITVCESCHENIHDTSFDDDLEVHSSLSTLRSSSTSKSTSSSANAYPEPVPAPTENTQDEVDLPRSSWEAHDPVRAPSVPMDADSEASPPDPQTTPQRSQGRSTDESDDGATVVEAEDILIDAPVVNPSAKPLVRELLIGKSFAAGDVVEVSTGRLTIVRTSPATSRPSSPDSVQITEDTRVRFV